MIRVFVRGLPPGSQAGVDLCSWQTGQNFRGFRDIPPGLHCIHITPADDPSIKHGVWVCLQTSAEKVNFVWNREENRLEKQEQTSEDEEHLVLLLDVSQAPPESVKAWSVMTQHMQLPAQRGQLSVIALDRTFTSMTPSSADPEAKDEETSFHFTPIDLKRSWRPGAVGADITRMSLDKTWLLCDALHRAGGEESFLAEYEACTLGLMLVASYACFEQWRTFLQLICHSQGGLASHTMLFNEILALLNNALQQMNHEMYSDILADLVPAGLQKLQSNLKQAQRADAGNMGQLQVSLDVLFDTLAREHGWEADDESQEDDAGEDEPVVVSLDDETY
ncbi:hypothetical protein PYCC9005_003595 [Savitreella phatthalungensis]